MVTFSLGTNSKRAANGSAARRFVMQMLPRGLPGPAAGLWHAGRGKLCHSPLSPLRSVNGEKSCFPAAEEASESGRPRGGGGGEAPGDTRGHSQVILPLPRGMPGMSFPLGCPCSGSAQGFGRGDTGAKRLLKNLLNVLCLRPARPRCAPTPAGLGAAGSRGAGAGGSALGGRVPSPGTLLGWQLCPLSLPTASRLIQPLPALPPPLLAQLGSKGSAAHTCWNGSGAMRFPLGCSQPSRHSPCWKTQPLPSLTLSG